MNNKFWMSFAKSGGSLAVLSSVLTLSACGGDASGSGGHITPPTAPETLQVELTSDQEAPVVSSAANARGTLRLDRATRTISGTITIDGLTPTAAHIHSGEAGKSGPVLFAMTIAGDVATLAPLVLTPEQLAALDAGGFYYDVHSAAQPDGEIRGQIGREVFVAHMTGSQQTVPVTSAADGDGMLVLDPKTGAVTGQIAMNNITATAANVHTAVFGNNGDILIPLTDVGDHAHFSVPANTTLKADAIDKLRSGGMYFNAATKVNASGEIRGQIGRRIFLGAADGTHEVPSTTSTATGRGYVAYNPATRAADIKFSVTGITATNAHIHQAPAGFSGDIIVPLAKSASTGSGSDWAPATASALTLSQAQALLTGGLYFNAHSAALPAGEIRGQIAAAANDASPLMHIVSPASGVSVARGAGVPGAGTFDGAGFVINLEIITRDSIGIAATESLNIRNASLPGKANPNMPTLVVSFDADLIKPDGTIIAKGTNLASLFNIAGVDDTPGAGITLWTGWHVLESFREETKTVTITASITDQAGRVATDHVTYNLLEGHGSGQSLTPKTAGVAGDGIDDADGPEVTMIAPRPASSVATGPATPKPPASGALFFVQVSALDKAAHGIASNENGDGKADSDRGTILDGGQIVVNGPNAAGGPNRNIPGLVFTLDVPLLQPTGNLIPAGANLAPLFNIAGSEREARGVRTTALWTVGGTLVMPAGKTTVTAKASVTDNAGRTGSTQTVFGVSTVQNGQELTPAP
ncbi:MAG TPA: CHRD domain-containing protein [Duganella sp.]|nr:CHRD domain-containing protein [Duganella sp.]